MKRLQSSIRFTYMSACDFPLALSVVPLNINIFFLCAAYTINLLKKKKMENFKILYKTNDLFSQEFKILLDGFKSQGESLAWKARDLTLFSGSTFLV